MARLIVLTGAPAPSALRWDEIELSDPQNIDRGWAMHDTTGSPKSSHTFSVQWRRVPVKEALVDTDQHTVDSQPFTSPPEAVFLNAAELTTQPQSEHISTLTSTSVSAASMQTAAVVLDDFYDQSLALHEDLTTSQLSDFQSQATGLGSPQWSGERTQVTRSNVTAHECASLPFPILPQHLNNLKDIPSAAYLRSIEPQTMTVNLIVGIMALPSPRPVTVGRRWGREQEMQLLEILVGDDTRAGFEITMWLSNSNEKHKNGGVAHQSTLESQMQSLRSRDVILIRNVALRSYQGKVHGQSLRRDVTKVDLLYRRKIDDSDEGGMFSSKALIELAGTHPVMEKAKRVRQWLIDFVGEDMPDNLREVSTRTRAVLPPDTQ